MFHWDVNCARASAGSGRNIEQWGGKDLVRVVKGVEDRKCAPCGQDNRRYGAIWWFHCQAYWSPRVSLWVVKAKAKAIIRSKSWSLTSSRFLRELRAVQKNISTFAQISSNASWIKKSKFTFEPGAFSFGGVRRWSITKLNRCIRIVS